MQQGPCYNFILSQIKATHENGSPYSDCLNKSCPHAHVHLHGPSNADKLSQIKKLFSRFADRVHLRRAEDVLNK